MFPIIEIIGSLAIGFVLGILLSFVSKKATNKDEMLIITLIAIGFGIGLGKLLEFSPLLINIAMGTTLINFMKQPLRIFSSVNDFIGPFYVLFFALAGASLHLEVLRTIGWIGIAYIFARGLGKYIGAYTGAVIVKSEPQVRNFLGLALTPTRRVLP
jgi:NhaP-type Na+/H+ or K+/H+ antiporter